MGDNDWHLASRGPFGIALDASQAFCGVTSQDWCGGDRYDIDVDDDGVDTDGLGELRSIPACVGADEEDFIGGAS
jgi:hypothetical protein